MKKLLSVFALLVLIGHVISQEQCGRKYCPVGQVCCNQSCGICTPPDGACTQQYCSGPNFSACFSATTTVKVEGQPIPLPMQQLQVGDFVSVNDNDHDSSKSYNYEQVYSFAHYHPTKEVTFLQIYTSTGQKDEHDNDVDNSDVPLEITPDHLVFLQSDSDSDDEPIPAGSIQVGDILRTISANNDVGEGRRVTHIKTVIRQGLYAPLTSAGTLVVNNGIVVSTYVDLEEAVFTGHYPWSRLKQGWISKLSHVGISPYRFICAKISNKLCHPDYYNDNGIPYILASLLGLLMWTMQQPIWIQSIILIGYLGFAALIYLVESIISSWFSSMIIFCCCAAAGGLILTIKGRRKGKSSIACDSFHPIYLHNQR